ncbi:cellulose synthase [Nocardioides mangrovicus]|uniref:Cellulose synthase n=1 Tax=Nocardioides mangrovicus TaxID=2478913 RepID=A0A3L8P5A2_9ACTN|nr:cellulose synthase [Nocardioides mangrovicus]RLV50314.1 cellulose synthase [Nocardioides mangrovicus]
MTLDGTTWAALAFVLTALGAAYTWSAWRRRGPAAGLRGLAWTLLPIGLWLTGTLRLASDVVDDVSRWAGRLVFHPTTWAGVVVLAVSAVLFVASGAMLGRGVGVRRRGRRARGEAAPQATADRKQVAAPAPALDDDVSAILKKHGIS